MGGDGHLQAGNGAASKLIPMRRTQAGEGGDEIDAAAVKDSRGEEFDVGG